MTAVSLGDRGQFWWPRSILVTAVSFSDRGQFLGTVVIFSDRGQSWWPRSILVTAVNFSDRGHCYWPRSLFRDRGQFLVTEINFSGCGQFWWPRLVFSWRWSTLVAMLNFVANGHHSVTVVIFVDRVYSFWSGSYLVAAAIPLNRGHFLWLLYRGFSWESFVCFVSFYASDWVCLCEILFLWALNVFFLRRKEVQHSGAF